MKTLKANNLTKLYNYLQLGGRYTTAELSEKFSLSPRTIQGYLKELREEYGLIKEKKLYYFSNEYRHVDIDERVQMSMALMISLYKNAIPSIQDSVLENFKQTPKESDAFLFDIDFEPLTNETYFNQITNAIIHEKAIHFKYTNSKNITSIKNIYPLKNTNISGYWYLMGFDLDENRVKTFYINNIMSLIVSKDESYLNTQQIAKLSKLALQMHSPWFNDDMKSVKLKVSGAAVLYIQRKKSKVITILKENKNELLVQMHYYNDVEVLSFVKKWLPYIEIEDNDSLKKKLYATLKEYLLE